jgi:virginiamycin B lyase
MRLLSLLLLAGLTALLVAAAAFRPDPDGTVTDASGAPLAGVVVSALHPDGVMGTSVVTDGEGRYDLPDLPPGLYTLRTRRIGYEEATLSGYDPGAGQPADFLLDALDDVFDQMPSSAFFDLLPDGEEKRAFILDCAGCHQFDQGIVAPDGQLRTRDSWESWIAQMLSFAGGSTSFPIISPSRDPDGTADWLVTHLGEAPDPLPVFEPPAPMTGSDAAVRFTEYDVPVPFDLPHDLLFEADGDVVITGMLTSQMYVLDPEAGSFTTVPIPVFNAGPRALDIAPDGTWWVLLGNPHMIASYASGTWTTYPIGMYAHDVVRDGQGRLWFNGHFTVNPELIGYLDPVAGETTTFEVPVPSMPDGGSTIPYGLRVDAEGIVWMTELRGNRLVRFDPNTFAFDLYDMPTPASGPRRLAVAPDGALWIPEFAANQLARFDPDAETFEEWALPIPDALPYIVRVDPASGVVWVATAGADAVLRFDPATEAWDVHRLPTPKALIRHLELDPVTGAAWVAYGNSPAIDPKVARVEAFSPPSTAAEPGGSPTGLRIHGVSPNPTRGAARVTFELPAPAFVRLEVVDARGRRVATALAEQCAGGRHEVVVDAALLPSGTYFVRLQAGGAEAVRPLTRLS